LSCSRAEAKTKALANLAAAAVIFKPPDLRQTFPRLKRIWKTTISAILPSKTPWGIRTQFAAGRYSGASLINRDAYGAFRNKPTALNPTSNIQGLRD
jgi:hypothetical protein